VISTRKSPGGNTCKIERIGPIAPVDLSWTRASASSPGEDNTPAAVTVVPTMPPAVLPAITPTPLAAPKPPVTVTVQAAPKPPPVTVTITAKPAPATVTVQAPPPPAPKPADPAADPAADERFLDGMRQFGYQVTDRQLALSNAHEACRLFRQGEPAAEVNQEMAARMHASLDATLMLTSSAMLSYPDC